MMQYRLAYNGLSGFDYSGFDSKEEAINEAIRQKQLGLMSPIKLMEYDASEDTYKVISDFSWTITDDDCCQVQRAELNPACDIYEMLQITEYPGHFRAAPNEDVPYFKVSHGRISMSDYSEEEIAEALSTYGYDNEEMPPPPIIAEMFFELENVEYELEKEFDSWNDAVTAIEEVTGQDLTRCKEGAKLDNRLQDAINRYLDAKGIEKSTMEKER